MQRFRLNKNRVWKNLIAILIVCTFMLQGCGREKNTVTESQAQMQIEDVAPASDTTLTITAIKGGDADAFVLIAGEHVTIIDTGLDKKADRLLEFLDEQGVSRVDELIITHFDKDHVGGADHVIDNYEVGKVYTTYQSKDSDDITAYREALEAKGLTETVVTKKTTFNVEDISFTIYPPEADSYVSKTSNNSSLVIKVGLGNSSMLFTGDAEEERIEELLRTEGLKSTILKVPHHGRLALNSAKLFDYIAPRYAIISSGSNSNDDEDVLKLLEKKGITTYLTKNGNITITMKADKVYITQ